MEEEIMETQFVPKDTVLEVQDGVIGITTLFNHIDKGLNLKKEEEVNNG